MNTKLIAMLGVVGLLAGCGNSFMNEPSSDVNTGALVQQLEQNCSADGYFDTLLLDKTVAFERDDETSSYVLDIPEWCMKLTASAPVIDNASGDVTQTWKDAVAQQANKWIRVSNATLNTTFPEFVQNNHIVIHSKPALQTLDQAVQSHYAIRPMLGNDYMHEGKQYCVVEQVNGAEYRLKRLIDVIDPDQVSIFGNLNSQLCGDDFPMQNKGFEQLVPSTIWYDENYSNRYVLYKSDQSQDKLSSLFANVTIEWY